MDQWPWRTPHTKENLVHKYTNSEELNLKQNIKEDNFIWVRPNFGGVEKGGGGSIHIPPEGTMVNVIFEKTS
jgi:hypothetical protein